MDPFSREPLMKGKAQYSWPPYWASYYDSLFCIKGNIYFQYKKPANLDWLVQGGQLYQAVPFSYDFLVLES
jgi:hypothetical protein